MDGWVGGWIYSKASVCVCVCVGSVEETRAPLVTARQAGSANAGNS
jgi:hypothetical protein